MIADTSEAAVWSLSDALLERDAGRGAARSAERLIAQGENVTGLIYGLASRLRKACAAAAQLEEGVPPKQVESQPRHAPLRGQAAGRAGSATTDLDDLRDGDRARSPTSRSGAAAAPTTATSWRSPWRCARSGARGASGVPD